MGATGLCQQFMGTGNAWTALLRRSEIKMGLTQITTIDFV